jgi:hypothetical protein
MECPICLTTFETDEALIPQLQCSCVFVVHPECWIKWNQACLYCRNGIDHDEPAQMIQVQNIDRYYKIRILFSVLYLAVMIYNIFHPRISSVSNPMPRPIQQCMINMTLFDSAKCLS